MENEKTYCLVVTCLPCKTPNLSLEAPNGCCECGMLEWLCYNTEEKANFEFRKEYPELFDSNGNYIEK